MKDNQKGFLGSFLSKGLKTNQLEVNTDEKTLRPIARLKEPRDLFALPKDKDHDCSQQAPRWPIECQVIEERIAHIPTVPTQPEPFYQPTGKELKPNPVGEENGIVVFNYNPISAVNYDKTNNRSSNKHQDDDSSDSDVSSCESQGSTPDMKTSSKRLQKNANIITQMLTTLEQRSSSNSNGEDDDDEDDTDNDEEVDADESGDRSLRSEADKKPTTWADENPITEEQIDDIWANKSPEYRAATPTYIRNQFGKDVLAQKYGKFSRSAVGGSKFLTNCHPYNPEEYDGLEFESRFESGNLAKAVQITPAYYELYLRPDLYTSRSRQWFYFRVRKTKRNMLYRFSIVNLIKSDSLYNDGMRPLMYSTHNAKTKNEGWVRCGDNICYYRNDDDNQPSEEEEDNSSYTLTFNVEFQNDNDTVYFAHSYPYTYSDLQDYLMEIQKNPTKSKFCKLRLLCRTLAGNNVYYLTVTTPAATEELMKRKKSIVISARVHPSETPSSWMMKGLMDFITGDSSVAKRLRHKFIFKLIPMLNPDGVIVGNSRNSLTGKDLNRQYRTVIRETYPSIWYTKALIKRLIDECGVSMYCDMHAHSRRHNIFIYGCENKRNPEKKLTEQVFPLMLHKNVADKFSFENCKFKIQRSKEGTGRIVVWMLGITNSYTIEASFGGSLLGSRKGTHFTTQDYEHMGRAFCETLLDYCDDNPNKECLRLKIIERLLKEGSSAEEPINIPLSDYSSDEGSSSSSDNEGKGSSSKDFSDLEGPCCHPLKAPPCSPELDIESRKPHKLKVRCKSLHRRKKEERLLLDLPTTDPGSDLVFSTDDEYIIDSNGIQCYGTMPRHIRRGLMQSELQRRYIEEMGDGLRNMPPELIITSPSNKSKHAPVKILFKPTTKKYVPPKSAELPLIGGPARRTSSWHNLNTASQTPVTPQWYSMNMPRQSQSPSPKPVMKTKTIAKKEPLSKEDLDIKLSLKKKIWTGIQPEDGLPHNGVDRNKPLSWVPPPPLKTPTKKNEGPSCSHNNTKRLENEAFLTACSQKLLEWQMINSNEGDEGTTGLDKPTKLPLALMMPELNEDHTMRIFKHLAQIKKPPKPKLETETKIKQKRNVITKVSETTNFIAKLSKTKTRTNLATSHRGTLAKQTVPGLSGISQHKSQTRNPNKFKTGGIVATAVQPTNTKNKTKKLKSSHKLSSGLQDAAMPPLKINGNNTSSSGGGIVIASTATTIVRKVKTKLKKKKSSPSPSTIVAANTASLKENNSTLTTGYGNTTKSLLGGSCSS